MLGWHGSALIILDYRQYRARQRQSYKWKKSKLKLRENVGVVGSKSYLKLSLLNVDGLSPSTFDDVKLAITRKKPDLCILLETKRRQEELGTDIKIDGYALHEIRRSDTANEKTGPKLLMDVYSKSIHLVLLILLCTMF